MIQSMKEGIGSKGTSSFARYDGQVKHYRTHNPAMGRLSIPHSGSSKSPPVVPGRR
jgi:hypothetical protein